MAAKDPTGEPYEAVSLGTVAGLAEVIGWDAGAVVHACKRPVITAVPAAIPRKNVRRVLIMELDYLR